MKINNVEIHEIDLLDADVAEKYEDGLNNVQNLVQEARNEAAEGKIKNSEFIRKACTAINDFIDSLWGEGIAYSVFNGRCNMMTSLKVFSEIIEWANDEKHHKAEIAEIDKIVNKYANRAERRRKDKGKS